VSRTGRRNHQFVNTTHSVAAGHTEAVFPFSMDLKPTDESYEVYACRLGLTVNCSMSAGSSFQIKDITVYDDSGRVVVEEPARFYSTPQRKSLDKAFRDIARDIAGSTYSPKVYPIIALADEPHVGNYAPMNAVARHFLQVDSRLTFYSTWPDDELLHANRATVTAWQNSVRYIARTLPVPERHWTPPLHASEYCSQLLPAPSVVISTNLSSAFLLLLQRNEFPRRPSRRFSQAYISCRRGEGCCLLLRRSVPRPRGTSLFLSQHERSA